MGVSEYSSTRLYGAAIGLAMGGYSLAAATTGQMTAAAWVVALAGAVATLHGLALLTPIAGHLGSASGPLMLLYALVMLGNQVLVWMTTSLLAESAMRVHDIGPEPALTGVDEGLVALTLLMFASGLITTVRGGGTGGI
jgi:hypothetical protein